jgi:hypothetical protein
MEVGRMVSVVNEKQEHTHTQLSEVSTKRPEEHATQQRQQNKTKKRNKGECCGASEQQQKRPRSRGMSNTASSR